MAELNPRMNEPLTLFDVMAITFAERGPLTENDYRLLLTTMIEQRGINGTLIMRPCPYPALLREMVEQEVGLFEQLNQLYRDLIAGSEN